MSWYLAVVFRVNCAIIVLRNCLPSGRCSFPVTGFQGAPSTCGLRAVVMVIGGRFHIRILPDAPDRGAT